MSKILFVYPNQEGYPIIPLGISVLAGILTRENHSVELFDVTFMMPDRLDHNARQKAGVVEKTNIEKYWGESCSVDIAKAFKKKLLSFYPDLIAFSIVENNYILAKKLFQIARTVTVEPIVVGGIFPTIAPEFFIEDENVDIICRGEGEYPLLELANKLDRNENIASIKNLIIKKEGMVIENGFSPYQNWEPLTYQDWEIFDEKHLYKPFMGNIWRTGFFELSRGCPYSCSYCANHIYQNIFKSLGKYRREKKIEYCIKEIEYMKSRYSLELIFFNDENFLLMSKDRLEEFCKEFKRRINLPFFVQTKAETLIDREKVKLLKACGCITIGIGVESGNERYRNDVLNKNTRNSVYMEAFANCNDYDIRTTAYVMIGLPHETEKDILSTAKFCRKLNAKSIAVSIFTPYHGSALRDICIKEGLMHDKFYENISDKHTTILNMPQLPKEKLEALYFQFNTLVYGDS